MAPSNPSLVKIFLDGGPLMALFLFITVLWLICTLRYASKGIMLRTTSGGGRFLWFPLAFTLLALSQWVLLWHTLYKEMEVSGYPDSWSHIQDMLVVTRSTLMIAVVGAISLLTTAAMVALPTRKNQQDEERAPKQTASGKPQIASEERP